MLLIHSFPSTNRFGNDVGLTILKSIFKDGFLCAPERLAFQPNPGTENEIKRAILRENQNDLEFNQSRFCVAMSSFEEAYTEKKYNSCTHSEVFGNFSIGIDLASARNFGFSPVLYYTPVDFFGKNILGPALAEPLGLSMHLLQALRQVWELLVAVSHIEAGRYISGDAKLPSKEELLSLGLTLSKGEEKIEQAVARLTSKEREKFLKCLDTDRFGAAALAEHIEILLSLFQRTDSLHKDGILEWYNEREFRLVFHQSERLVWRRLVNAPDEEYKALLDCIYGDTLNIPREAYSISFRRAMNILQYCEERHVRKSISFLGFPHKYAQEVACMLSQFDATLSSRPVAEYDGVSIYFCSHGAEN